MKTEEIVRQIYRLRHPDYDYILNILENSDIYKLTEYSISKFVIFENNILIEIDETGYIYIDYSLSKQFRTKFGDVNSTETIAKYVNRFFEIGYGVIEQDYKSLYKLKEKIIKHGTKL
jgi:hypothetical protein